MYNYGYYRARQGASKRDCSLRNKMPTATRLAACSGCMSKDETESQVRMIECRSQTCRDLI